MAGRKRLRKAALRLLKEHGGDRRHHEQVARLSLETFDELAHLHGMNRRARRLLECAALLHDVGRSVDDQPHHKASFHIIFASDFLPLKKGERRIVGAVARYHTGAPPSQEHAAFARFSRAERRIVRQLSAFLRVADALDASHREAVDAVTYRISKHRIVGRCRLRRAKPRLKAMILRRTDEKADLLERIFDRNLELKLKAA